MSKQNELNSYIARLQQRLRLGAWLRGAAIFTGTALLVTVVLDNGDEGHAVLTVTADKGDLVLDNKKEDILLWSMTGYRFVKRQSQSDPSVWVSLIDPQPVTATATGLFGILRPRTHD